MYQVGGGGGGGGRGNMRINPIMHNFPKWPDTLQKCRNICCENVKACLTILGHCALKV